MSGGGGSSSDSGGGNDMQVSGMEAAISKEKGISTYADTRTKSSSYSRPSDSGGGDRPNPQTDSGTSKKDLTVGEYAGVTPSMSSINPKTGKFESGGFVDSDDVYDTPDKEHFSQTQKEIAKKSKDVVDTKMSREEYNKFNEELNKRYGTKGVKYEPYGRAGEGTVNLTFKEHWDNVGMQYPATQFSPVMRFLIAGGRNINEYLKTDYGTYKYAGPGTDTGGLLGSGERTRVKTDRQIMNEVAPDAPYIVSGMDRPDSSPAADFFANMNKNKHELFFQDQYDSAKAKMQGILGSPSPMRYLAVSESPFYNWLKDNSLDKGIL